MLLEENLLEHSHSFASSDGGGATPLSAGKVVLGEHATWLKGRAVLHLAFSDAQPHIMVSAHSPKDLGEKDGPLDIGIGSGLLCVWDLHDCEAPTAVLVASGGPLTCCCLSPGRPYLAVAGSVEGSVKLWDMRGEPTRLHNPMGDERCGELRQVHHPAYSTDVIGSLDKTHGSPICDMQLLVSPGSATTTGRRARGSAERASFQLATLDNRAVVHVWTVVELQVRTPFHTLVSFSTLTRVCGAALGESRVVGRLVARVWSRVE